MRSIPKRVRESMRRCRRTTTLATLCVCRAILIWMMVNVERICIRNHQAKSVHVKTIEVKGSHTESWSLFFGKKKRKKDEHEIIYIQSSHTTRSEWLLCVSVSSLGLCVYSLCAITLAASGSAARQRCKGGKLIGRNKEIKEQNGLIK